MENLEELKANLLSDFDYHCQEEVKGKEKRSIDEWIQFGKRSALENFGRFQLGMAKLDFDKILKKYELE